MRSPQKLAKSRRDYLAQAEMLPVDERTLEAVEINKALGIKAPKGTAAAATLDTARAAYIRLLGSLDSNAEVKAEVTRFREQLDQVQLQMLRESSASEKGPISYGRQMEHRKERRMSTGIERRNSYNVKRAVQGRTAKQPAPSRE